MFRIFDWSKENTILVKNKQKENDKVINKQIRKIMFVLISKQILTLLFAESFLVVSGQTNKQVTSNDLTGKWSYTIYPKEYSLIFFTDQTVFIENHLDSALTYHYAILRDTLITWKDDSVEVYKNRMVSFDSDRLVLDGIRKRTGTKNYSKKSERKLIKRIK